jgi:aspartate-semialdehyde dehydrogenase
MLVSTYQAASGAGTALVAELEQQARDHVSGRPYTQEVLDRPYLFNLFCHDSPVGPDGYNEEERKLVRETHKIWADESVRISATCVRVPVLRAHSEALNLTLRRPLAEDEARALLAAAPGIRLVDNRSANRFPEPANATGIDEVLVGRIRADLSQPPGLGLELFVCGDQLRKGAALNAVQVAERVLAAAGAML